MTAILSTLETLYAAIEANPLDVATWHGLANWYLEEGDDVACEWSKWVTAKGRDPANRNKDPYKFEWWLGDVKNSKVPRKLASHLMVISLTKWNGLPTIASAYQFLLEGWRLLSDTEREECWSWEP